MKIQNNELYRAVREDLLAGKYPPGIAMLGSREIAAKYGVNKDAANGVLAMLEAEGLLTRDGRRRYPASRHKSTERVIAIEYMPHCGIHPFTAGFHAGLLNGLLSLQYGVHHFTYYECGRGTSVCEAPVIASALERGILKGIVFPELSRSSLEDLQTFRDNNVVTTALERERKPGAIVLDVEQAALRATTYLLLRGYSSVGIVSSTRFRHGAGADIRGYRQALVLLEKPVKEDVVDCVEGVDDDFADEPMESDSHDITHGRRYQRVIKSGFDATLSRIGKGNLPRALYIADEFLATGALRAIRQVGLRIPDDVAVISHASANNWSLELGGLTVMRFDGYACGLQAGQFIVDIAEGRRSFEEQLILEATLVKGASCGDPECDALPEIMQWGWKGG
ncbi:MAG: substrate-binding domain-containing protein [Armatimonadetes bacterium]|nr:substrate-binding domain-containing protein [Armatimonadota bacterium]